MTIITTRSTLVAGGIAAMVVLPSTAHLVWAVFMGKLPPSGFAAELIPLSCAANWPALSLMGSVQCESDLLRGDLPYFVPIIIAMVCGNFFLYAGLIRILLVGLTRSRRADSPGPQATGATDR